MKCPMFPIKGGVRVIAGVRAAPAGETRNHRTNSLPVEVVVRKRATNNLINPPVRFM